MSDLGSGDEVQVVKKKTLKDSYKTPLYSRDNSLKLNVRVKKGLIYFYDVKETKLK